MMGTAELPLSITRHTAFREIPSARAILRVPCPFSRSLRIDVRVFWSSITLLLVEIRQARLHIRTRPLHMRPDFLVLAGKKLAPQSLLQFPVQSAGNPAQRAQFSFNLLDRPLGCVLLLLCLLVHAQKNPRVLQYQLACSRAPRDR